ncbi:MAG: efflux RND transporter periplasmic adaptor subunit [Allorhizobium sp.]
MKSISSLTALLIAGTILTACQKEETAKVEPPRPVLSQVIMREPAARLTLPGTIEARIKTEFSFRILGRIIARNVNIGDLVKKGDVLAAIDPLAVELAVKSAQSDLANSEAQLANALTNEERQRTLFEKQSAAKATYESAQQELKTAEAAVAKSKANLNKANEQLGYSRLLAEFDGVVTSTSAQVGQVVSAGQSVATVARPEERDAVIDVPEMAGEQLKPGVEFDVSLQLDPTVRAKGTVREIAPQADEATRTQRTKLTLIDPPEALRLGAVITASVILEARSVIRVPASAIRTDGSSHTAWVISESDNTVSSRAVSVEGSVVPGGSVIVAEGLKAGERIAVAGVHKLEEGQTVRVDQEMTK